jgi:hypothetical protein
MLTGYLDVTYMVASSSLMFITKFRENPFGSKLLCGGGQEARHMDMMIP